MNRYLEGTRVLGAHVIGDENDRVRLTWLDQFMIATGALASLVTLGQFVAGLRRKR